MALADKPPIPFRVPPGMKFIPIDRQTGLQRAGRRRSGHDPRSVQAGHRAARHLFDHRLHRPDGPAADGRAGIGPGGDLGDRRAVLSTRSRFTLAAGADYRSRPFRFSKTLPAKAPDAPRDRESRRRDQAGDRPAEEASLTGIAPRRRLAELNAAAEDSRLWNRPERAQAVMRERQQLDGQIARRRAARERTRRADRTDRTRRGRGRRRRWSPRPRRR